MGQRWSSAGWVTRVRRSSPSPPHSSGVWAQRARGSQGTNKGFAGIKISEQVKSTNRHWRWKLCHFLDWDLLLKSAWQLLIHTSKLRCNTTSWSHICTLWVMKHCLLPSAAALIKDKEIWMGLLLLFALQSSYCSCPGTGNNTHLFWNCLRLEFLKCFQ